MQRKCCECHKVLGDIAPFSDGRVTHGLCVDCLAKAMKLRIIYLKRIFGDRKRTFGVLMDKNGPFAVTLEDPWLDNQKNISCIPAGSYLCVRKQSPKFGDTFEVRKVRGRSHILIHKGNTEKDTHGCILVGKEFNFLHGEPGILESGDGFNEFMSKMRCVDRFLLKIEEV